MKNIPGGLCENAKPMPLSHVTCQAPMGAHSFNKHVPSTEWVPGPALGTSSKRTEVSVPGQLVSFREGQETRERGDTGNAGFVRMLGRDQGRAKWSRKRNTGCVTDCDFKHASEFVGCPVSALVTTLSHADLSLPWDTAALTEAMALVLMTNRHVLLRGLGSSTWQHGASTFSALTELSPIWGTRQEVENIEHHRRGRGKVVPRVRAGALPAVKDRVGEAVGLPRWSSHHALLHADPTPYKAPPSLLTLDRSLFPTQGPQVHHFQQMLLLMLTPEKKGTRSTTTRNKKDRKYPLREKLFRTGQDRNLSACVMW